MSDTVSEHLPFSFTANLTNTSPASREDGNNNHVVSHRLCGFQGHVGGHIVVMKEQCGACVKTMRVHSSVSRDRLMQYAFEVWPWPPLSSSFTGAVTTIKVQELSDTTSYIA
jgi:hypothetical protein